ncbi:hypothetical protein Aconfl_19970 [Algoriphagus confluentis]|uniref:Uncharacterized protein n=1 Tax=Algoriphagus confluentis TaxID=1697556 RepID=A0ABQ6PN04_9BACT|nr:hypothetical protein Aconfl_19970 [Algoriphagus confluentis]
MVFFLKGFMIYQMVYFEKNFEIKNSNQKYKKPSRRTEV